MPQRIEHVEDMKQRLEAPAIAGVEGVERSRVVKAPPEMLPLISIYGTNEQGRPAHHGAWWLTHNLSVEVAVTRGNGWDAESGRILEEVKRRLFSDPEWLSRWKEPPSFSVRFFMDEEGADHVCGEILTLTCEDAETTSWPVTDGTAMGADVDVDLQDGGGPDGNAETGLTINPPPE